MLMFFRTDREHMRLKNGKTLAINPSYWGEKLEAIDRCDGFKAFSEEKFNRIVAEYLVQWVRENACRTTKEQRRELWNSVVSEVIYADGDSGGHRKQSAAYDFYHFVNDDVGNFEFVDLWEHDFTEYTYRFMWCCYALGWGVLKYDEVRKS